MQLLVQTSMVEPLQKRILVVDDEEPVRVICSRMLTPLGYQVETVENGDLALTLLERQSFDLVLTDYRMPGELNGLMLGHAIKQLFPLTQIILMTAFPAVDTAVETLRMGGLDYLIKPFDQTELIHRVQACFTKPSVP
jgi:DNA-binding NtrC family response regulator